MISKKVQNNTLVLLLIAVCAVVGYLLLFSVTKDDGEIHDSPFVSINGQKIPVIIARTPNEQRRGLSGMFSLPDDRGMLFLFGEKQRTGFWMKEMNFPIDIVWISGRTVVGIEKNVDPQIGARESELKIYYPPEPVDAVLEINAGKSDEWGMRVGGGVRFN